MIYWNTEYIRGQALINTTKPLVNNLKLLTMSPDCSTRRIIEYLRNPKTKSPHLFDTWEEGEYLKEIQQTYVNYLKKVGSDTITIRISNTSLMELRGSSKDVIYYFASNKMYSLRRTLYIKQCSVAYQNKGFLDLFVYPYKLDLSSLDDLNNICTLYAVL